jgi:hypothetical protein
MTSHERALRKQLLLIKGEALRMQLGIESGMLRQKITLAGTIARLVGLLRDGFGLFGSGANGRRSWLRTLLQGWSLVRTARALYRRF